MMRIKVLCGICKGTKYYSIHRGITKVSSIIVCDNCRHFYQKLKKFPFALDCISPIKGSCFKNCSFMKTRCKGCWAMQVLDSCPHSTTLYLSLSNWLSEDCKKQIRGIAMELDNVPPDATGKVSVEEFKEGSWVQMEESDKEVAKLPINNEEDAAAVAAAPSGGDEPEETKDKEAKKSKPKPASLKEKRRSSLDERMTFGVADLALLESEDYVDLDEEEAMIDDPAAMPTKTGNATGSTLTARGKVSERIKRKRKKVEYFTKTTSGRKTKGPIYGSDGRINKTGKDLCDCLQSECVGCHFPCPKCRSPKCGTECRVNRRWYYERVEVEGTKMFWMNRFVAKV